MLNHVLYIFLHWQTFPLFVIKISIFPWDKVRDKIGQQPSQEQNG